MIHLARFGDCSGAHALVSHTGMNEGVLAEAVWRTDMPPHGDAETIGVFVTGYQLGDYYVVQRTKPDAAASRSGMVATVTAFLPVAALGAVDLGAVFEYLEELNDDIGEPVHPRMFCPPSDHRHPLGSAALTSTLLVSRRAVWSGSDGLDVVIPCLWRHLGAEERSTLVFGAAFHPEPLAIPVRDGDLVVLAVPERARMRWTEWPMVDPDSPSVNDPVRDAFWGQNRAATDLGVELLGSDIAFHHWRPLVSLSQLQGSMATLDHERLRLMLQLLGMLAPAPSTGAALKMRVLDRLVDLTPSAGFADIRGLRGLPWASLPGSGLSALLRPWAMHVLGTPARLQDGAEAVTEILARPEDAFCSELDNALRAALGEAGRQARRAMAVALLQSGAAATEWLVAASRDPVALDIDLAAAASSEPPAWLAGLARKRRLARTHAAAAEIADGVAAWRSHLAIERRPPDSDALLAARMGPAGTVAAARQIGDAALIALAAERVATDPELLRPLDLTDPTSRILWAEAVSRGAAPWRIIGAVEAARILLDLLVAGEVVPAVLLESIARTKAADLSGYSQRAAVWDRLPDEARRRMLTATAQGLGRQLKSGDPAPEPTLAEAMLDTDLLGRLAHDDGGQAVIVLAVIPASRQEHAVMVAQRGRFTGPAAIALAELIIARGWKRAAESVVNLAKNRRDLEPTASRLASMFSLLERLRRYVGFRADVRGVATQDELRDALSDLVARLYSSGPSDRAIWERAGGLLADLPDAPTPRHRWGLALSAISQQQSGAPLLADLLRVMRDDYPNNRDLQTLTEAMTGESS